MILTLVVALAVVGLVLVFWLKGSGSERDDDQDGPKAQTPTEEAESPSGPDEAPPKPGRYLLLLTDDEGLVGALDERLVFRGERLYSLGPTYSGAPFLDRRHVREIIWPEGVDPKKYPAK